MRHLFVAFVILITTISTSNAISASTLTGEFLYDPSFKLMNSFGKGPEL